jgi:thioesterase domain-containing protein
MDEQWLVDLQQTLHREMPICAAMDIAVTSCDRPFQEGPRLHDGGRLAMGMPLAPNRNHQDSAFAGSLNALCTVVGWGTMFLLLEQQDMSGNIVIRRGNIRYRRPVRLPYIVARSLPLDRDAVDYFYELLRSKEKSKLDVAVEIVDGQGPLVAFQGSYVVKA